MGSRVMHYIVSLKLIDKLQIDDKVEFVLGGIAADASQNKEASHFFEGDHADYTREIAYEKFYKKYKHNKNEAYILGYYAHLLTDHIWLTGFFLPWLKNRMENDLSLHKLYHHDFSLLNRKLANYYNVSGDGLENITATEIPDLEEVSAGEVKKLVAALQDDLGSAENDTLKVFTFNQIVGYIETSIQVCTKKLKEIMQKKSAYNS